MSRKDPYKPSPWYERMYVVYLVGKAPIEIPDDFKIINLGYLEILAEDSEILVKLSYKGISKVLEDNKKVNCKHDYIFSRRWHNDDVYECNKCAHREFER